MTQSIERASTEVNGRSLVDATRQILGNRLLKEPLESDLPPGLVDGLVIQSIGRRALAGYVGTACLDRYPQIGSMLALAACSAVEGNNSNPPRANLEDIRAVAFGTVEDIRQGGRPVVVGNPSEEVAQALTDNIVQRANVI